jgi:NAD(P)-dependent dehydrogenase (short-subunit alcohol dehydrogenase family)
MTVPSPDPKPAIRRVFITGASSGIGEAFARHYAAQGAQVGLVARRKDRLQQLADVLGPNCAVYALDVRDPLALEQAAHDFMRRFGVPDIVIANAGVSRGTMTELSEDIPAFQAVFDINVMGVVHTFHPFVTPMRETGRGQLVGIASVAGLRGLPGSGAYSASKAAAISYLESLRVELADSGVAVTTICPGFIRTPMTALNPYRMPFLMDADVAVRKMVRVVEVRRRYAIVPWQMAMVGRVLGLLPPWLWDVLTKHMQRKPRMHQEG